VRGVPISPISDTESRPFLLVNDWLRCGWCRCVALLLSRACLPVRSPLPIQSRPVMHNDLESCAPGACAPCHSSSRSAHCDGQAGWVRRIEMLGRVHRCCSNSYAEVTCKQEVSSLIVRIQMLEPSSASSGADAFVLVGPYIPCLRAVPGPRALSVSTFRLGRSSSWRARAVTIRGAAAVVVVATAADARLARGLTGRLAHIP
jgi:hypothetical protein